VTDRIDELQRLHEAATKGPWRANGDFVDGDFVDGDDSAYIGVAECYRPSNAELIAAMRNALPALLRVARAAKAAMAKAEKAAESFYYVTGDEAEELLAALGELEREP
jgi:hypothetical protein